jgi:group I intron endonuclease
MNKISGIYGIRSISHPERVYIGSAINLKSRERCHYSDLHLNKHGNSKLQKHYNKYGPADLIFETILCCDAQLLIKAEQLFINLFNPWFNICPTAGSQLGFKHKPESKDKMRNAKLGKKISNKTKERMSLAQKGRMVTQETRDKISDSEKGKYVSPETRKKISDIVKNSPPANTKMTINLETGIFYNTIKEAAATTNIRYKTLAAYLSGRLKNKTMFALV